MSGGPPHHHHNRQPPPGNTAWNHLQVPNFFPSRQPQHAHMSNEHHILHQPTWHTPTTEASVKPLSHSHIFNLEQMLSDRQFPRHAPGVDLSLARNGGQNGDLPTTPISLSVRDTNKINSLPPSALDVQAFELTKCVSPGRKSSMSPGLKPASPTSSPVVPELQSSPKNAKRPGKRVDSILERLIPEKTVAVEPAEHLETESATEKPSQSHSVIVQAASSVQDDNSNSSGVSNLPVSSNTKEDDATSMCSNEDSLDSSKSRRKRKPTKTVRVSKEEEIPDLEAVKPDVIETLVEISTEKQIVEDEPCPVTAVAEVLEEDKVPERRRSNSEPPTSPKSPRKTRRKASSESETIANIAAMVQQTQPRNPEKAAEVRPISVSVIKTKDNLEEPTKVVESTQPHVIVTPAQKKIVTNTHFVEVENKLEEMFAGIEDDTSDPLKTDNVLIGEGKNDLLEEVEPVSASQAQDVTSTSNDFAAVTKTQKRSKRKASSRRSSECSSLETTPKKKSAKKAKTASPTAKAKSSAKKAKKVTNIKSKIDTVKDVYAYDSGSNASSSKSKGPFIQIRGPRDSPLSVSVINAPSNEEDSEKKLNKSKKYHDDSEYRHKVRSKGLHCSTLSNKYDSQTRDASWICAFCKRGPHTAEKTVNGGSVPGDLFGPYVIGSGSPEFERRLEDPYDRQFKSKKVTRCLEATNIKVTGKKSKRKHSESFDDTAALADIHFGITDMKNGSYEVWAHEDCIVWSMGVYLIGPKIIGLEESIWTSCNVPCDKCRLRGANICCLKRGCTSVVHFCCATIADWQLNEDNFTAFCPMHKKP